MKMTSQKSMDQEIWTPRNLTRDNVIFMKTYFLESLSHLGNCIEAQSKFNKMLKLFLGLKKASEVYGLC